MPQATLGDSKIARSFCDIWLFLGFEIFTGLNYAFYDDLIGLRHYDG
jgi:hypothetical protein